MRIHDVGLSRLSLPKENISAVFQQMRAERKQYAATFKAEGAPTSVTDSIRNGCGGSKDQGGGHRRSRKDTGRRRGRGRPQFMRRRTKKILSSIVLYAHWIP